MSLANKQNLLFIMLIISIYILAWGIQDHLSLNADVSQLLHSTQRMLAGGTYTKDFFIPNPPMIMYLYTPPVLFTKIFSFQPVIVFRTYIFLLASLSILFCNALSKNIFTKHEIIWRYIFISSLAASFLILPLHQQGQRDCLLLIFTMPYMLAAVARLKSHNISASFSIVVGIFAGLGFAIKPHFIALFFAVEIYFCLKKRNLFAWIRYEAITIIAVLLMYTLTSWVFFQDYFTVIIPFLLKNYTNSISKSWSQLILTANVLVCVFSTAFWLTVYKNSPFRLLGTVLAFALMGLLLILFSQRSNYLYHRIPSLSVAILLMELTFATTLLDKNRSMISTGMTLLVSVLTFSCLIVYFNYIWLISFFNPVLFYGFIGLIFLIVLSHAYGDKKTIRSIFAVGIILFFGFFMGALCTTSRWSENTFAITILSMLTLLTLFVSSPLKQRAHYLQAAIIGILLFFLPLFILINTYDRGFSYKKLTLSKLIDFMKTQPRNRSLYALTYTGYFTGPLADYTNASIAERFDYLWMTAAYAKEFKNERNFKKYIKFNHDKFFFINMVAEDFKTKKPDLVFVDKRKHNMLVDNKPVYFDFLSYFSENAAFKKEWKSYQYLTSIYFNQDKSSSLDIYQRKMLNGTAHD